MYKCNYQKSVLTDVQEKKVYFVIFAIYEKDIAFMLK